MRNIRLPLRRIMQASCLSLLLWRLLPYLNSGILTDISYWSTSNGKIFRIWRDQIVTDFVSKLYYLEIQRWCLSHSSSIFLSTTGRSFTA